MSRGPGKGLKRLPACGEKLILRTGTQVWGEGVMTVRVSRRGWRRDVEWRFNILLIFQYFNIQMSTGNSEAVVQR